MLNLIQTSEGVLLELIVQANSGFFSLRFDSPAKKLRARCKSAAIEGKANNEIIKELKKLFKTEVELIKGIHSKQKTFLIKERKASEIESLLKELI